MQPCTIGHIIRPFGRGAPDRRFLSQTSSIDFLIGQGFDFNKLFKEGVSYLLPSELEKLKEGLKERQESIIQQLYRPHDLQCKSCGVRFSKEKRTQYDSHLDWHFR